MVDSPGFKSGRVSDDDRAFAAAMRAEGDAASRLRITCVHQGFELYGSDRCFIETVRTIRAAHPTARIDVVLPRHGPIVAGLEPFANDIVIAPLWILRRKNLARLATLGLLTLPIAIIRALRRIRASDLVYINTTVVADYLLAARLAPGRSIVHVHEIPEGVVLKVLRGLIRWSGANVVFNSRATEGHMMFVHISQLLSKRAGR